MHLKNDVHQKCCTSKMMRSKSDALLKAMHSEKRCTPKSDALRSDRTETAPPTAMQTDLILLSCAGTSNCAPGRPSARRPTAKFQIQRLPPPSLQTKSEKKRGNKADQENMHRTDGRIYELTVPKSISIKSSALS